MNESKGALTEAVYYILISLYTPLHGYGVIQNVEKISGGRVRLGAGTLYGAINNLLGKGWIIECGESGDRKKEYIITEAGRGPFWTKSTACRSCWVTAGRCSSSIKRYKREGQ